MIRSSRKNVLHLLLALVLTLTFVSTAQAKLVFCRSDPVVILSNGTILDLSADFTTLLINVEEVHYELHIPVGVSVVAYIHTPAWLTSQETFTAIADQEPGVYTASTIGRTRSGNATVTTHLVLLSAAQVKLDYATASGPEGQPVFVRVEHG